MVGGWEGGNNIWDDYMTLNPEFQVIWMINEQFGGGKGEEGGDGMGGWVVGGWGGGHNIWDDHMTLNPEFQVIWMINEWFWGGVGGEGGVLVDGEVVITSGMTV